MTEKGGGSGFESQPAHHIDSLPGVDTGLAKC